MNIKQLVLIGITLINFSVIQASSDVKFASKQKLLERFSKKLLDHFVEKTKIVDKLLEDPKAPLGVALAIDLALEDYEKDIDNSSSRIAWEMTRKDTRSSILEIVLQDDPKAFAELQKHGLCSSQKKSSPEKTSLIGTAASAVATAVGNITQGALPAQVQAVTLSAGSLPITGPSAFLSYGRRPDLFGDSAEEIAERGLRERLKEERKEAERRNEERKKGQSGPKPLNKKEENTKTIQTPSASLSIPGQDFFKDSELDLVERELADRLQEERMREAAEEVAKEAERKKQEEAAKNEAVQQAHLKALQLLARLQRDSQDEVARNAAALRVQQAQMQAAHSARVNEALRSVIADAISNGLGSNSSSNDGSSSHDSSNDRERGDGGNWTSYSSRSGGNSSSRGTAGSLSVCGRGRESLGLSYDSGSDRYRDGGSGNSWDGLGNK